jgi:hypothetical protein
MTSRPYFIPSKQKKPSHRGAAEGCCWCTMWIWEWTTHINLHKNSKRLSYWLLRRTFIFFCFFDQSGDDFFKRQDPSNTSINECNNDQTDVVLESYCISYSPLLIVSSFEVSPLWYSLAPCETHLQSISIFISDTSQAFIVEAFQVLDRQNQIQLQITRDQEVAQMHLIHFQPFQSRLAQPE